MPDENETIVVTFRPAPDSLGRSVVTRLKRILKYADRAAAMKCVDCKTVTAEATPATQRK